jgi:hypothetical protein
MQNTYKSIKKRYLKWVLLMLGIQGSLFAQTPDLLLKLSGTTRWNNSPGIAMDSAGNSYITGNFTDQLNFGNITLYSEGWSDAYVAKFNRAGICQWAKRAGGGNGHCASYGIALSGNAVYIVGSFGSPTGIFTDTINFNTPSAAGSNELAPKGFSDIFIAKYDDMGHFQWAQRAGGRYEDGGFAIAASDRSVYITGHFVDHADFGMGSSEIFSGGGLDAFIAKYDDTGHLHWVKRAGGGIAQLGRGIAATRNSVYIVGGFYGTVNFNNPSAAGSNELASEGDQDAFLAKYNSAGVFQWAKRWGGIGMDIGTGIALTGTSVYVCGSFSKTANFNTPFATGSNEISSAGDYDMYLAKFNDAGRFQWAKRAGGTGLDECNGIAVSGTGVCLIGSFRDRADFNTPALAGSNELVSAGGADIFLAKYNNTGNLQWTQRAGGLGSDIGLDITASGTTIALTGTFEQTANFNTPSASGRNELVATTGLRDIFIAIATTPTDAPASTWELAVRPNPFNEKLTLIIDNQLFPMNPSPQLIVTNAFGAAIETRVLNTSTIELDTRNWAIGLYSVSVYLNGQRVVVKNVIKN